MENEHEPTFYDKVSNFFSTHQNTAVSAGVVASLTIPAAITAIKYLDASATTKTAITIGMLGYGLIATTALNYAMGANS